MVKHFDKTERKQNNAPNNEYQGTPYCNRKVKYMKQDQVQNFSLLISKRKQTRCVKDVKS